MDVYTKTTNGITVTARPQYLEEQSEPEEGRYFWAYTIELENHSSETVQLLSRYWHITDAMGRSHEVRGPGVVGKQPVLQPGGSFRYTSGVPLGTPSGIMFGEYEMVLETGAKFQVDVPAFSLECPFIKSKPN
jgi:ApaG protein